MRRPTIAAIVTTLLISGCAATLALIEPFQSGSPACAGGPKYSSRVPMMLSVGTDFWPPRSAASTRNAGAASDGYAAGSVTTTASGAGADRRLQARAMRRVPTG